MRERGRNLFFAALGAALSLASLMPAAAGNIHYTVVAGDSLSRVAEVYGVTVGQLVRENGIVNADLIFPGQVLQIITGDEPGAGAGEYQIEPGDTLSGIARRFGVSLDGLQATNAILDPNLIIAGQRLKIPSGPAPPPSVPGPRPASPVIEGIIDELSEAWSVDAGLVRALAWVESGWDQGAVSPAGAVGVMQLMPGTAAWLEADVFGEELNEDVSVYDNVKMGVALLRILLDATGGDIDLALASYYQGYGSVLAGSIYEETRAYVRTVRAVKDSFWP